MQRPLINTLLGATLLLADGMTLPALAAGGASNPAGTTIVRVTNKTAFDMAGTIDWIDFKLSTNNIVIGDHSFTIGSTVRVHTPQGVTGKSALRPGVRVGYHGVGGVSVLTDLWVLPAE